MIQDGIYYDGGMPQAFRLLQLNFLDGTPPFEAKRSLGLVWEMLKLLTEGKVQDLRNELRDNDPDVVVDSMDLQVMLGYGARFFDDKLHSPQLTNPSNRPRRLIYLRNSNKNTPYNKLKWKDFKQEKLDPSFSLTSQTDIALQFTANSELAVNRAIVEVSKLIFDKTLPLRITNFFRGFKREDKRSWIDFHDGINNMSKEERIIALEIRGVDRDWIIGGTYMSFLQINVNLELWRSLPRQVQELLVGRNKLTGCPIVDSKKTGNKISPVFMSGCPVNHYLPKPLSHEFIDPPQPNDAIAQSSHIFRSNLNRGSASQGANNRIYRQGYEFLEPDKNGGILQGLNFVGFHRSIKFLTDILSQDFWMGDVNFGGVPQNNSVPDINLMELLNGAYYAIPPKSNYFPGSELFSK